MQLASSCARNRTTRVGVPVASHPDNALDRLCSRATYTEVHLGTPGPWQNVAGLTTSYTFALSAGALIAGLVLSISLIPKVRHRQR
jgi:hypothetical protein